MRNNPTFYTKTLIDIWGDQMYQKVRLFYENVFKVNVPKVIAEGRTYALYKIFEKIFESEGLEKAGKVYTTHTINQIPKNPLRMLFVIDIIEEMQPFLPWLKMLEKKKREVAVWCIECNAKLDVIGACGENPFGHVEYKLGTEIRKTSANFSKAVLQINPGYLSFVNSYVFNGLTLEDVEKAKCRTIIKNDLSPYSDGITSEILWDDFFGEAVVEICRLNPCIRFYQQCGVMIAIPYVFIPALKPNEVCSYCKKILSFFDIEYPEAFGDNKELLYKWTVYALSQKVLEAFIEENGKGSKIWEYDEVIDNSEEIFCLSQDAEYEHVSRNVLDTDSFAEINRRTLFCDKTIIPSLELIDALNISFYRLRKNEEKHKSLMVSEVVWKMVYSGMNSKEESLSEIIRCLDCDKCDMLFETSKDDKAFDAFLYSGNQSMVGYYRELHKNVYGVFCEFFKLTNELRAFQYQEFADYMDSVLCTDEFGDFFLFLNEEYIYSDFQAVPPVHKANGCEKREVRTYQYQYYEP